MRVLVIPEDFRQDQYLLHPLFSRLFQVIGRRVHVQICRAPLLGGVDEALKSGRIAEVISRYRGMVHVVVLCVDRDGNLGRQVRLRDMEREFGNDRRAFLAENAWEELETWVLAGLTLPRGWLWSDVRAEVQVKERYFDPLHGSAVSPMLRGEDESRSVWRRRVASTQSVRNAPRTSIALRGDLRPRSPYEMRSHPHQ